MDTIFMNSEQIRSLDPRSLFLTQCQSEIIELEPRTHLEKSGFSGQILIKLRL